MANSLLITTLPMDQMNTLAADLHNFAPESTVNGAWNAILNQTKFYAQPDFMVEPEYSIAGTGEADLLVRKQTFAGTNVDRKWRVVYEGKTRGAAAWNDIRTQVIKYPKAKLTENQVCWCIGGMGKLAKFWKFKKGGGSMECKPVEYSGGVARVREDGTDVEPYDIANDQIEIEAILLFFRNNEN